MNFKFGDRPIFSALFYPQPGAQMLYLYLPIKMKADTRIAVPLDIHERFGSLIQRAIAMETGIRVHSPANKAPWGGTNFINTEERINVLDYVYLTVKSQYVSPDNPGNRPGWHTDGFGTDDINYIWSDIYPTQYAYQDFIDIPSSHKEAMEEFEKQIRPNRVLSFDKNGLYRLHPGVVHRSPQIPEVCLRNFVKISFSKNKYNLLGNSHNYLFDYNWRMYPRDSVRNEPHYEERDFVEAQ